MNVRSRLLLVCFAVALPLLLMSGLIIWREYQGLKQAARRTVTFEDMIAVRILTHWTRAQQATLQALAVLPEIQNPDQTLTTKILSATAKTRHNWQAVLLADPAGRTLAASTAVGKKQPVQKLEVFRTALKTAKPSVSGYAVCPATGKPAVIFAVPVLSGKKVKAILLASVKPESILHLFSGLGESQGSVIAIIDQKHRVLSRTLENGKWAGKDFSHAKSVQAAQKLKHGTFEAVGIADPISRTYAFDQVPDTKWVVVVGIPTQAINGSAYDRLMLMILFVAVGLGISMAVAYGVTDYFTGPINELVREAVAIGRGDLSKRVTTRQKGELGLLARAFNQMAINLELNHEHKEMVEKISEAIRQSLDLDQILNTAVTELGKALSASRCCLALFPDAATAGIAGRELEFNYVWWNPLLSGTALRNRSLRITQDSMLKLILEQQAILSLDVIEDKAFTPLFESGADSPDDWRTVKSLIACPIVFADQSIGMILVHQCNHRRAWLDLELELVEAVAGQVALAMEHANLYAKTKTFAEHESLINNIVRSIRSSLDMDIVLGTVVQELGVALQADYCQIVQPRPEGPLVVTHEFHIPALAPTKGLSLYGNTMDFAPEEDGAVQLNSVLGIDLAKLKELTGAAREIPISVIPDAVLDERTFVFRDFLRQVGSRSLISAPLLQDDRLLGILIVHQCRAQRQWQQGEVRLTAAIADQLAVAISHSELFAQVKHQAITDGLTQLYNHVYFKNRLAEELNRAHRKSTDCSLLMLDLDKLKQINDTLGHPIGDAAIRQVAMVLKSLLRSGDTAARYGGEEFAVILPDTPLSEALLIAERLRQNIHRHQIPGLGQISTSIGCACFPAHAGSVGELIDKADRALYVAKRSGRNRVCVWSEPQPLAVPQIDEAMVSGA
ncbi:MAG: diguanylate cyclase [Candidatus Obscuribacterales bacterium]|nr:diguanylate cyclase [Candidatus Obscuribacterales bacterium]